MCNFRCLNAHFIPNDNDMIAYYLKQITDIFSRDQQIKCFTLSTSSPFLDQFLMRGM